MLSLAVVGFMWKSVIYSTDNGLATQLFGGGKSIDWLGNQSFVDSIRRQLRRLLELRGDSGGDRLETHRLHHGALPRRTEERRQLAAGSGHAGRQQRVADVFRHVVFPSLKPINVVIAVITVIEALRAFDIIYVLNVPRKTEVLSILTTNNLLGEGGGNVGRGSAYATILFILCFGFVIWYVTNHYRNTQEGADA